MNNEIVLIIPDIHHKVDEVEKIIRSVGADKVIFLGDYFDNIDDTPEVVKYTCDWLVHSVKMPNRIHPYRYWIFYDFEREHFWSGITDIPTDMIEYQTPKESLEEAMLQIRIFLNKYDWTPKEVEKK